MHELIRQLTTLINKQRALRQQKQAIETEIDLIRSKLETLKNDITVGIGSDPIIWCEESGKHYALYNDKACGPTISPVEIIQL